MRRPGITAKLFLALLGGTLAVLALMVVALHFNFRCSFLDYVHERQQEHIAELAELLGDHYAANGDWSTLSRPEHWHQLLRYALHHGNEDADAPSSAAEGGPPRHPGPRSPSRHLVLLDTDREKIAGTGLDKLEQPSFTPIKYHEETVGYLAYPSPLRIPDPLVQRFQAEQLETAAQITLVAVVLAFLLSLGLARSFLGPVSRLAEASRRLTAGHFNTRISLARYDELGQLAGDFNRLAETLERNERLRREVMADLSHELRTPVSVLRGEIEALEDGVRPLDQQALGRLQEHVTGLGRLIDDLYELALADAGALDYRKEPIELNALLAELVEQWRSRFEAAQLVLELETAESELWVEGDRRRLGSLWHNLLQNSLRYTTAGGSTRITAARIGASARATIEDTAPGIAVTEHEAIFERLYRVEGSRSRDSGGSGLGLALCWTIAEAHGGSVRAYSAALGGLGVEIELPLRAREE
ncbi:ATP-binding protein [Halorhodospira neutriphila]|uniref:histidine kinase n=1 Tax=Halorhodospira neutriphila TaxID=168379 RepID=A0ABS1E4Z8_9GAMM|nr:ATP-binding protein [Halorhodospira neutriphila]MBK1725894.1 hypothetical protein [Halorhodospira neutriphila]